MLILDGSGVYWGRWEGGWGVLGQEGTDWPAQIPKYIQDNALLNVTIEHPSYNPINMQEIELAIEAKKQPMSVIKLIKWLYLVYWVYLPYNAS